MGVPPEVMAYNVREAAELVHVSERTIRRAIASGSLRAVRIGRAVRVPREALAVLLSSGLPCTDESKRDTAVVGVGNGN
jgi:excisionase family DNA binding protein